MIRLTLVTLLLIPLAVFGCKQDEGERCQIDGDCGGGLVCCIPVRELDVPEGTCESVCQDGGSVAPPPDGAPMDESVDAPSSEPADAGPVDVMFEPISD